MVYRARGGLGDNAACVRVFDDLKPYAEQLLALRSRVLGQSPDWMAIGIAWDGLETAAYHFTRRRNFYYELQREWSERQGSNNALGDRQEAIEAFKAMAPYVQKFRRLMERCPPQRRDYLALMIAVESLETAALHFTRVASFYGAQGDSAGPTRAAF